ncbi:hypothetical protein SLA2020_413620 [Shorea laevis]
MATSDLVGLLKLMITCLVLVCMAVSAPKATAVEVVDIDCQDVVDNLLPCGDYVIHGGSLTRECCSGTQNLYRLATTAADRRIVCECIMMTAGFIGEDGSFSSKVKLKGSLSEHNRLSRYIPITMNQIIRANQFPNKCGVHISFWMHPIYIDCNKYIS